MIFKLIYFPCWFDVDTFNYQGVRTMVQFFSGYLFAVGTVCCELYLTGIDGWMTHNFTAFSTIFQSYEDDRG